MDHTSSNKQPIRVARRSACAEAAARRVEEHTRRLGRDPSAPDPEFQESLARALEALKRGS